MSRASSQPDSFVPVATYVKVYVLENGVCLAKKKTKVVKRNLDPTYQQALLFDESPQGKVLQVGEWFICCAPSRPTWNHNANKLGTLLILSLGNRVGGLRAYGPQVLHGNGPDPLGGLGPLCHSQRLVQVVPYLFLGRSQHRTPHQTPLPVLLGERHQPLVLLDT